MASLIKPPTRRKPTVPKPPAPGFVRPAPPPPVGRPKAKMNTFKKPATPGVIDNPKAYQKRHPNAILAKGPGGTATVKGRRTSRGKQLRAKISTPPMRVKMPRPIGY